MVKQTGAQKIFTKLIEKAESRMCEGTDPNGQKWDVKTPQLTTPKGKYIFDAAKEVGKMQKDFDNNENIIINTQNITPKEIQELYEQLKAKGHEGRSVWWPIGPSFIPKR